MSPVFVFGTGRCGSTHIQRLISLSTKHWIWGEHAGFLGPLLSGMERYESSAPLAKYVFPWSHRNDSELMVDMVSGAGQLSWLNRLEASTLRLEMRALVDTLFRRTLPEGWTEWGFKEILYGLGNDVPAILLDMFPESTAAFTFRDPRNTIESMIRTWTPGLLDSPDFADELRKTYRERSMRWKIILTYFVSIKERFHDRLIFVSMDNIGNRESELIKALRLPIARELDSPHIAATNQGQRHFPDWARSIVAESFQKDAVEFGALYDRASCVSRTDLDV